MATISSLTNGGTLQDTDKIPIARISGGSPANYNVPGSSFMPRPASAISGQVLMFNGTTNTWVASALPTSIGNSFKFASRTVLSSGGPYTPSSASTVATGTVNLASFAGYADAKSVQLYIKIFTTDGGPASPNFANLTLSVGAENYGTVLAHSYYTDGTTPRTSQVYFLVNAEASKIITFSLATTSNIGSISYEIAAVGKF